WGAPFPGPSPATRARAARPVVGAAAIAPCTGRGSRHSSRG
ncbi:MAG: hypothetical protein AVDCRST_MAG21-1694, partial [uncultured Nocardioidaceae bacterium]